MASPTASLATAAASRGISLEGLLIGSLPPLDDDPPPPMVAEASFLEEEGLGEL
jgi:hypothetical protein